VLHVSLMNTCDFFYLSSYESHPGAEPNGPTLMHRHQGRKRSLVVYNNSMQDHARHLAEVFTLLQQHQLFVKRSRCSVLKHSLEYREHIISVHGVATDRAKIEVVLRWPVRKNTKQLCGFLGLVGYYHKFIMLFSIMCCPLMNIFNKNAQFMWTPTVENSFVAIKRTLVQAPVLALPNFTKNCP
jgi:hypothetical protein